MKLSLLTSRLLIIPVTLGLVVFLIFWSLASLYQQTLKEQQRVTHLERVGEIRANIEGAINGATNLTAGLIAVVSSTGSITPGFFSHLSEHLMQQNSLIRNITLAPNNIIEYVYPLEGNEAALGLDLLNHPTQGVATQVMILSGAPILAGPYELAQGGIGVIHRVPIFVYEGDERHYWGLMSTPISLEQIIQLSGILALDSQMKVALRSIANTGADGQVFWGDEALFEHPASLKTHINVLQGHWEMALLPDRAIPKNAEKLLVYAQTLGGLFALLVTLLTRQLLRMHQRLQQSQRRFKQLAHHDSLTGLPNRMLLQDRFDQAVARAERQALSLILLYMDLDGFKRVNDEQGHQIGDRVLAQIANRLRHALRTSDSIVRMGGDEFVVLIEEPCLKDINSILMICDKLMTAANEPITQDDLRLSVGISIGIACFPHDGLTLEQLISAADQAMYQAKARGKNQRH